jgi:hypothetical protein
VTLDIVKKALIVAAVAVSVGALINTADWISCRTNGGGDACSEARNLAVSAWTALGMNALALATNIMKEAGD